MYISARVLTGGIRVYSGTSRSDDSIVDRSDQTLDSTIFHQLRIINLIFFIPFIIIF